MAGGELNVSIDNNRSLLPPQHNKDMVIDLRYVENS